MGDAHEGIRPVSRDSAEETMKNNAVDDINNARQRQSTTPTPSVVDPALEKKRKVLKRALSMEAPAKSRCKGNILTTMSSFVIITLEKGFFRLGHFIGRYPVLVIVLSLVMCMLTGLGMSTYTSGNDDDTIWVPKNSRLLDEKDWAEANIPTEYRFTEFLMEDSNVLTAEAMNGMLDYYLESLRVRAQGKSFSELCRRIGSFCSVKSLLELWSFNETLIRALTDTDVINALNSTERTERTNTNSESLLGGTITRDASGKIVSAQAMQIVWTTTKEDESASESYELIMIDIALKGNSAFKKTFVTTSRSFEDEGSGAMDDDLNLLAAGFIIVFAYIIIGLGRFNLMEQKIYLSITGILCVGLSLLVSYGVGTALGVVNSPISTLLPFLLLGIGVDDMFVIVEAWKNLSPEDSELDIPEKVSICLAHAGMSITVTSLTDIVAFGIGASTVIPALGSFCIYATLGIVGLFLLVTTLFVAVLALDERRRRDRRDACICCYRHSDSYSPNKCSTGPSFLQTVFKKYYSPFLLKTPVKVVIIILSLAMFAIGAWRFSQIEEDFDSVNYIPSDSYAHKYARSKERLYDTQGYSTRVYCGALDYLAQQDRLNTMHAEMLAATDILQPDTINSWFTSFQAYLTANSLTTATDVEYYDKLYDYVNSVDGERYSSVIIWNSTAKPAHIVASFISAIHVRKTNAKASIGSMDKLRDIIDTSGFPKFSGGGMPEYMCFCYDPYYMRLETNKVLGEELMRNLILAGVAVLVMTLILVANILSSVLVFFCVAFTVVDVGGVLELWGTTIDTASSVLLTLAVGLAVDYSAHIAHTFMSVEGTREERAFKTLTQIGPAVFNGGLSTLLAFILLANSASYAFVLFFRVFMSVVLFGMFHGLCLLPVVLSLIGPESYKASREEAAKKNFFEHGNGTSSAKHRDTEAGGKRSDDLGKNSPTGYNGPYATTDDERTTSPNITNMKANGQNDSQASLNSHRMDISGRGDGHNDGNMYQVSDRHQPSRSTNL